MQHATPDLYSLQLPVDGTHLDGRLAVPARARGLVIFAHGSGSGMQSPRNGAVAADLRDAGLATLLFDLLDPAEQVRDARDRSLRFDIPLLGRRLGSVVDWAATHPATAMLSVGLYGASTGAAAALIAAADFPDRVAAVVSRGGRPDLAGAALRDVQAPTLLIVGSLDHEVLQLNQAAASRMVHAAARLEVVRGATHLFEEPGTMDEVARLTIDWFCRHLPAGRGTR